MGEAMTKELGNRINGKERPAAEGAQFEKRSPHDGSLLYRVAQSTAEDVNRAVTAGTYGSETHMPFGGLRQSGNGTREPGTEALDVYSELKDVNLQVPPERL